MALSGGGTSGFLSEKSGIGGLANWQLGGLVLAALLGWSWWRNRTSSTAASSLTTNPATTASQTPPTVFVVPGATGNGTAPPPTGRTSIPTGQGDYINPQGNDLGPWLFGSDQVTFVRNNIGQYGYTQQISDDVKRAYDQVTAMYGTSTADQYHYGWYSPGQVTATPPATNTNLTTIPNLA